MACKRVDSVVNSDIVVSYGVLNAVYALKAVKKSGGDQKFVPRCGAREHSAEARVLKDAHYFATENLTRTLHWAEGNAG